MSFRYQFLEAAKLRVWWVSGTPSYESYAAEYDRSTSRDPVQKACDELVVMAADVDLHRLDPESLSRIRDHDQATWRQLDLSIRPRGVILCSRPMQRIVARLFTSAVEREPLYRIDYAVLSRQDEAEDWLRRDLSLLDLPDFARAA